MKKLFLLLLLVPLVTISQNLQWQWAKRGGSPYATNQEDPSYRYNSYYDELLDIQTDASSNAYFLGSLALRNSTYDGMPIQTYGTQTQYVNTLLTKTDCNGNYLWHKTIGAFQTYVNRSSLQLSSSGGVYVGGTFLNISGRFGNTDESTITPLHIDTDSIFHNDLSQVGTASLANKFIQLIKYDTEGNLQWVRSPEDTALSYFADRNFSLGIALDSEENIHWAVYFRQGSYLNGRIQVPENGKHYYVIKYDRDGNYVSHTKLAATGETFNQKTIHFKYSETHNQYVFSIMRYYDYQEEIFTPDSIENDDGIISIVMAFNATSGITNWYHANSSLGCPFYIGGMGQDNDGNIYVSGFTNLFGSRSQSYNTFAGYAFNTPTANRALDRFSFLIKLNEDGILQWGTTTSTTTYYDNLYDMDFDGDKLLVAGALNNTIWGTQRFVRPAFDYKPDPVVVSFNKNTGEVLGFNGVEGQAGSSAAINAIKVVSPNNYIVGGYYKSSIFHNEGLVTPLYVISSEHRSMDYFLAKLGTERCSTASTENFETSTIKVYPNPTNGILHVSKENVTTYHVFNVLGQKVQTGKVLQQQIDISKQTSGIYILDLASNDGEKYQIKVVKK